MKLHYSAAKQKDEKTGEKKKLIIGNLTIWWKRKYVSDFKAQ